MHVHFKQPLHAWLMGMYQHLCLTADEADHHVSSSRLSMRMSQADVISEYSCDIYRLLHHHSSCLRRLSPSLGVLILPWKQLPLSFLQQLDQSQALLP